MAVQVWFPKPDVPNESAFRSGDYWLIPARVASRDIEWPWDAPPAGGGDDAKPQRRALPPHGVDHHYALIGLLGAPGAAGGPAVFTDLRHKFSVVT